MANSHFAAVPNISIPRSRFKMTFDHATTMYHGDLVPIDCMEILPGDTFKLKLSSLVWMSTPIRPIFGNINMYIKAFFVPMRLVWIHTEEFFGANKTSAGYQTTTYSIPQASMYWTAINENSVSHYLGKPIHAQDTTKANNGFGLVSTLKERGYYLIWSEKYRAEQVQDPAIVSTGDNGVNIATIGGVSRTFASTPLKVNKEFDYFTASTIAPQYGPAVTLPLGSYAPIVLQNSDPGVYVGAAGDWTIHNTQPVQAGDISSTVLSEANVSTSQGYLLADLQNATAATVNTLRYAFAVQKYLERANFGGSRFFEILAVHYGVTSPDSRLQIPEKLGEAVLPININTVLSTADTGSSGASIGQPGATSCSVLRNKSIFTKAFVEPGYVFIMASTHHKRSYTQGLLREDTKKNRFEFYSPEFANLGDQATLNKEIYVQGNSNDEGVFGYQEHWAEYRYRPDRVSGLLDPQVSNGLDFWVLTENFGSLPNLSGTFLQENRDAIARCLTSGVTGPEYVADFYFDYTATREMPLYTIPGLIDHFGEM